VGEVGVRADGGERRGGGGGEGGGGPPPPRKKTGPVLHAGLAVPLSSASLALQRGEWPVPEDESGAGALDFDIPRLTKFMLVSAHLATMNREAVDKRLFGHMIEGVRAGTAAVAQRSGKRKRGALSADKQSEAAATAALDGPGTFRCVPRFSPIPRCQDLIASPFD
jgi:origin recognition complex subunit 5